MWNDYCLNSAAALRPQSCKGRHLQPVTGSQTRYNCMKKALPVLLLLCFRCLASMAQDNKTPFLRNTFIKVNPTTLINELDISLEQELTEKLSVEVGISGIYTDYPDYVLAKKIDIGQKKPDISTEQFVDGRGLGFRASLRWYLISRYDGPSRAQGTYFQPVLFYKKVFYPNEEITLDNNKFKQSADKAVYGLQLLLGRQFTKDKFILDPYLGVGLRAKVYHYDTYNNDNGSVQRNSGRLVSILPAIHLGIKMGLKM